MSAKSSPAFVQDRAGLKRWGAAGAAASHTVWRAPYSKLTVTADPVTVLVAGAVSPVRQQAVISVLTSGEVIATNGRRVRDIVIVNSCELL